MTRNDKLRQFLGRELSVRQLALIRSERDVARIVEVCEEFCGELEETIRNPELPDAAAYKEEIRRLVKKLDKIAGLAHY